MTTHELFNTEDSTTVKRHIRVRIQGAFLVSTVIICGIAARIIPQLLKKGLDGIEQYERTTPEFVHFLIDYRTILWLALLPSFMCGVILVITGRRPWTIGLIGWLMVLTIACLLGYGLIALLAPWYEYQPL